MTPERLAYIEKRVSRLTAKMTASRDKKVITSCQWSLNRWRNILEKDHDERNFGTGDGPSAS